MSGGLETDSSLTDSQQRAQALQNWFQSLLAELSPGTDAGEFKFSLVQGDASFRRYFRVKRDKLSYILVDAPPTKEDSRKFISIARLFGEQGVQVPVVYKVDFDQGFLCLSDFGDTLLWSKLNHIQTVGLADLDATSFYDKAFEQLLLIQHVPVQELPLFSASLLQQEMELFRNWFCEGILNLKLNDKDNEILSQAFEFLNQSALAQEQLCVHRDYHSRNLLYLEDSSIGVIDFQDAVCGPFSYDLVSLLKDCYIAWPISEVQSWALKYRELAMQEKLVDIEESVFLKSFDLMGAQRHLKAIGIFSRLCLRDHKITYLADIPRTLSYLHQVSAEYAELKSLHAWLEVNVMPDVESKILSFANSDNRPSKSDKDIKA